MFLNSTKKKKPIYKPEKRKEPVGFEEQNMYCCPPNFGFEKTEVLEKATAFALGINFP